MKTIKEIVTKPSEALQAMVNGLLEQSQRSDFQVTMSTYGGTDSYVCFGCAATRAVQNITGINFQPTDEIIFTSQRAKILNFDKKDLDYFEISINAARLGELDLLFWYYGLECPNDLKQMEIRLSTDDWKDRLEDVQKVIKILTRRGY